MIVTRQQLLLLAAVLCFVVALLAVLGAVATTWTAWLVGGLLALALGLLP